MAMNVQVRFLDGDRHHVSMRATERVHALKERLAARTGCDAGQLQLCCNGQLLGSDLAVGALPSGPLLTAWTARYSSPRSEEASALARVHQQAAKTRHWEAGLQLCRTAQQYSVVVLHGLRCVPRGAWVRFVCWTSLMLVARHYRAGLPFVIATLIWLMLTNLGERKTGDVSAYTVFNRDYQTLPGQLRAEDIERELRHQ